MEGSNIRALFQKLLAIILILGVSTRAQVSTPCTSSMVTSFTPCLNFITGSSANGSSPTGDCCNSVRSLTGANMDCLCLLLTANVPLQLPINQTLALGLPRACNVAGVPLQCKATGSPLQAPGPAQLGPTLAPTPDASFSPQASKAAAMGPALPPSDRTSIAPNSPLDPEDETPTATPRIRPVHEPTTSDSSNLFASSSVQLMMFLGTIMKLFCH